MHYALLGSFLKQERKSDQIDESPHVDPPGRTVVGLIFVRTNPLGVLHPLLFCPVIVVFSTQNHGAR